MGGEVGVFPVVDDIPHGVLGDVGLEEVSDGGDGGGLFGLVIGTNLANFFEQFILI